MIKDGKGAGSRGSNRSGILARSVTDSLLNKLRNERLKFVS